MATQPPPPEQSTIADACKDDGKLDIARKELHEHLTNLISRRLYVTGRQELAPPPRIKILHSAPPSDVRIQAGDGDESPAIERSEEAYRCKCAFQIVPLSRLSTGGNGEGRCDLAYVTREGGDIRPLRNDTFPPANMRIRRAMKDLMGCLNRKSHHDAERPAENYAFERLRCCLTSVTFVTSWGDSYRPRTEAQSAAGGDCLVTLHYGPPGLRSSAESECQRWKDEARSVCPECDFTSLSGRSKGLKISVPESSCYAASGSAQSITDDGIIHDDLWLTVDTSNVAKLRRVSLVPPPQMQGSGVESNAGVHQRFKHICVQYQKPATAFQHPNAGVMLTSLHWLLGTISKVAVEIAVNESGSVITEKGQKPRLLEMYCGCGAHTVPLAKSALLSEIVAVELDDRLVEACRNNCRLNDCLKETDDRDTARRECYRSSDDRTLVRAFKGDAGEWATRTLRAQNKRFQRAERMSSPSKCDYEFDSFDILLVDPPREGLSPEVCNMALKGSFNHVIYISCGRRALIQDLTILCSDAEGFDVVDLAVIDLFPGTDAVESLVHLRRRDR